MTFAAYLDAFAGRRDCFATWTDGDWRHHAEHLTPRKTCKSYQSGRALALYCLGDDGRSHIAAVDFDRHDGLELATALGAWLIAYGALPYVEPSRDGRAHLWVILGERLPVETLRRGLSASLMSVPPTMAIVTTKARTADSLLTVPLELRPMTVPRALGNSLRAPLFPHPRNGMTYPLLGPHGERMDSIADLTIERTDARVWQRLAELYPWRVDADAAFFPDWPTVDVAPSE